MLADALLVAGKDLRLEARSRVTTNQMAPFALLVLLLFGFALDAAGRNLLDGIVREAAAGGATVLLASHELDRAAALATRTVTMAGGQVTGGLIARDADPAPGGAGAPPGEGAGAGAPAGKASIVA